VIIKSIVRIRVLSANQDCAANDIEKYVQFSFRESAVMGKTDSLNKLACYIYLSTLTVHIFY